MKIVQNALFRSCAARFDQIAFWSVKVLKIVTRAWNSLLNGKIMRFPWKLYKTLFLGHAQHVLAKSHFWSSKYSKSSRGPESLSKTRKQCAFHKNWTRRSFQAMRISLKQKNSALTKKIVQNPVFRSCAARFGQIAFLSAKVLKIVKLASNSLQSGKTVRFSWKLYNTLFSGHAQQVLAKSHFGASKFSKSSRGPEILSKTRKQCAFHENCTRRSFQVMRISSKPKNSALSKKILQNPVFRSCAARFGQIAFLSVKALKIVTLAWNSRQNGKTVRLP